MAEDAANLTWVPKDGDEACEEGYYRGAHVAELGRSAGASGTWPRRARGARGRRCTAPPPGWRRVAAGAGAAPEVYGGHELIRAAPLDHEEAHAMAAGQRADVAAEATAAVSRECADGVSRARGAHELQRVRRIGAAKN
jgi:hypothetical protein